MFIALWHFIQERYPLKISLGISLILSIAPLWNTHIAWINHLRIWFIVFSILLILRIFDDISDIHLDRIIQPERGLSSEKINIRHLKGAVVGIGILVVILNTGWLPLSFLFIVAIFYLLFFKNKEKISIRYRFFLTNLIFFLIPFYTRLAGTGVFDRSTIWLGLFIGFSAIAHDIAHSIQDPTEIEQTALDLSDGIRPKVSAISAAGGYLLAAGSGAVFFISANHPTIFLLLLIMTGVQISYLSLKLILHPVSANARLFYVYGFTFFLIPLTGLIFDEMMNMMKIL
jgi:4-hydroxybenzoate polyprenyltransferase